MRKIYKIIITASFLIISNTRLVYADTFSNFSDIEQNIYQHLQNRDSEISFSYVGNRTEFKNNITQAIISAYSKDDYTARAWVEIKPNTSVLNDKIDTTLKVSYLTSLEQEKYIDNEIKKIMTDIIKVNMSDLEKIRAINDYLINRYEYDYSLKSNNAYTALTTAKTICQGYSMTAYKMLNYAGIENRIIVGSLDGVSHSWNYILVNNKWYHLDITNNDAAKTNKYYLVENNVLESNKYEWNKKSYPQ